MNQKRIAVAFLQLSAVGFISLVTYESFVDTAMIPTKGDRWTVGYGSTYRDDGTPVQPGDTITPPKALARSQAHIAKDEQGLKRCVTGDLSQKEYDLLVDFSYQYGVTATCNSGMVRHINTGSYEASCKVYGQYKFSQGRDCSLPVNWGPKGCKGVWLRNLERMNTCLGAQ